MEKLDWTLDWTGLESGLDCSGLDRTGLFLEGVTFFGRGGGGGGGGGVAVLFFLICKMIALSTFRQKAI